MNKRLKYFLAVEYIFCSIFAIYLISNYYKASVARSNINEIIFFAIILFITRNLTLFFNSMDEIATSISLPIYFPAFVILNPLWIAIIAFISTIELKYRNKGFVWYKFLFNRTMFFITGGLACLVFKLINQNFNSILISFLLASIIYYIVNNGLVFLVLKFANQRQEDITLAYFIQLLKNIIVSYFLGIILYFSYIYFGILFFVLVILLIYIIKDIIYSNIKQINSFTQIIESFLKVIDSKDHYTQGHCERVAKYTKALCKAWGISKLKTERIVNISRIHDIGKIKVPDKILKSKKRLSDEEYEEIKNHSEYGYEILEDINLMKEDIDIILHHHERFDGKGYPQGLTGKEIPKGARILSICDAFDVMTTGRCYKRALTKKEVIKEIKKCSGNQFDPDIVKTMIDLIKQGEFDDCFKSVTNETKSYISSRCSKARSEA